MNAPNKKHFYILCFLLALVTLATFAPVVRCEFINYDDPDYVTENKLVQRGLTWEGTVWAFKTGFTGNWHPLTWLSHMFDCQIYGLSTAGHHFTNLIFHVVNTLLLFSILTLATGALRRSAMVAVLFALHPLHVESVAWISERKDVLSTFFLLLSLGAYFRYVKIRSLESEAKSPCRAYYFIALIFFALGLMAKPMLVTLPFLLLILDFWPLERFPISNFRAKRFQTLLLEKLPFFALSLVSCVVTFFAQKEGGAVHSLDANPFAVRISNVLVAYCRYVEKFIWPTDLSVLYPLQLWPTHIVFLAGVFLVLVSFAAIRTASKHPYFVVGWFWFLGTLVPVIGFVQVGAQSMADRYTYIPFIGIFITVIWTMREVFLKFPRFLICLAVLAIIGCAAATSLNLGYWKNSVVLFEHALAVTDRNYIAHNNLATALKMEGNRDAALKHFEAALRAQPNYAEARYNIAVIMGEEGKTEEAIAGFRDTLRMNPGFGLAHYNLGNAMMRKGEVASAIRHYRDALKANPTDAEAHNNLASALQRQGEIPNATKHFQEAIRLQPDYPEAHYNLALILIRQGKVPEAISHFQEALRLKPDWPAALNFLARILATSRNSKLRNGDEAVKSAERACQLANFENVAYLDTLGAAFAEKGDFAQAINAAQKAKKIATASGQKAVGEQIEMHIGKYQNGQPLREF